MTNISLLKNNNIKIQNIFDNLYLNSKNKNNFKNLFNFVVKKENILLALDNLKKNKINYLKDYYNKNIDDLDNMDEKKIINKFNYMINNFKIGKIKKTYFNEKIIYNEPIFDKLIYQSIKQVLEPICEAKFFEHSYGGRKNRSKENSIARFYFLSQRTQNFQYCIDLKIENILEKIDHGKFLKQLWSLGIKDKKIISIISKIIKNNKKVGLNKDNLLTNLFLNIFFNEMDWWISSQWQHFKTNKKEYCHQDSKIRALKDTKLKKMHLVRHLDDIKIFCTNYNESIKIKIALENWIKERLKIDLKNSEIKIKNLRKVSINFLNFKIKLRSKNKKFTVYSNLNNNSKKEIIKKLKIKVKNICKKNSIKEINIFNSYVLGIHNYFKIATNVNLDFHEMEYKLLKFFYNRTKNFRTKNGKKSKLFIKYYGKTECKLIYIKNKVLFPIGFVQKKNPTSFTQEINDFSKKGREYKFLRSNNINSKIIKNLLLGSNESRSELFQENKINVYIKQNGLCKICDKTLEEGNMELHHIIPLSLKGNDEENNLIFIRKDFHKLIHAVNNNTINKYLNKIKFIFEKNEIKKIIDKINYYRLKANKIIISYK